MAQIRITTDMIKAFLNLLPSISKLISMLIDSLQEDEEGKIQITPEERDILFEQGFRVLKAALGWLPVFIPADKE